MHDHRLPLLLLALSLPVTTSYGRVYSLSPHLGDVGGGMRVNLTGRDFVDYGDVPVDHPNRDEPVRVCVEVTTNNDPDQATDDCQLFTYFDD